MAKLGIDASMYLNTAAATPWTTPTWAELDGISDLTENCNWDVADIVIRRSLVKQGAKTIVDVGVSCKILREPANPLYVTILTALRLRTPADVLILDASINSIGAEGVRYMSQVTQGGGSQGTGDALFRDLVFVPFPDGDPTHVPEWANVAVGGTVTLTPIQPPIP